jgi:hypothetical protein
MASKIYIAGPSNIFVQVAAGNTWAQLGWSEGNVSVVTGVKHSEVSADYAGGMAADISMQGEEVSVTVRLSRYVESVFSLCKQRLNSTYSSGPGVGLPGALGALLGAQNNTYGLAIISQYQALEVFSDMLPGIYIPKSFLVGNTSVDLGTGPKLPVMTFGGLATFGLDGSYVLFNSAVSGLQLPDVS